MVIVRFFAGARAAAGMAQTTVPAGTLAGIVHELTLRHGTDLARVMTACSFLVDGTTCHDQTATVTAGATLDILPPFAGG